MDEIYDVERCLIAKKAIAQCPMLLLDILITAHRYGNALERVINQRITRIKASDKYLVIELRK